MPAVPSGVIGTIRGSRTTTGSVLDPLPLAFFPTMGLQRRHLTFIACQLDLQDLSRALFGSEKTCPVRSTIDQEKTGEIGEDS